MCMCLVDVDVCGSAVCSLLPQKYFKYHTGRSFCSYFGWFVLPIAVSLLTLHQRHCLSFCPIRLYQVVDLAPSSHCTVAKQLLTLTLDVVAKCVVSVLQHKVFHLDVTIMNKLLEDLVRCLV